jgi:hypothetical protein
MASMRETEAGKFSQLGSQFRRIADALREMQVLKTTVPLPDLGIAEEMRSQLGETEADARVFLNPYGHMVTKSEMRLVMDFFLDKFGIRDRLPQTFPEHEMVVDLPGLKPYLKRDAEWREVILRAFASGTAQ